MRWTYHGGFTAKVFVNQGNLALTKELWWSAANRFCKKFCKRPLHTLSSFSYLKLGLGYAWARHKRLTLAPSCLLRVVVVSSDGNFGGEDPIGSEKPFSNDQLQEETRSFYLLTAGNGKLLGFLLAVSLDYSKPVKGVKKARQCLVKQDLDGPVGGWWRSLSRTEKSHGSLGAPLDGKTFSV